MIRPLSPLQVLSLLATAVLAVSTPATAVRDDALVVQRPLVAAAQPACPGNRPCNDGNPCTFGDRCRQGVCAGTPYSCNDGNVCTSDSCDGAGGCTFSNNTAPCNDGNACTQNDTCSAGACFAGSPIVCNDGNVCTTDSCDPAAGCIFASNFESCDDGNACTSADICGGGVCSGTAYICPVTVSGITTATAIAAGGSHTCAVLADGAVKCWGAAGQLGDGTGAGSATPVAVSGITSAAAIAAGRYHTCAILADGTARCWGDNSSGQLGNGTTDGSTTPVVVTGISSATVIAAGGFSHTCAVLADGTARCWGANGAGELGNVGSDYCFCVWEDGSEWCLPCSTTPLAVSGITTATAIAAGRDHSCAVLADGTARCWGNGYSGQLGNGSGGGSITPVEVSGITSATAIAAGGNELWDVAHSCALMADGAVRCWGENSYGQLGIGTNTGPEICDYSPCSTTPVEVSGIATATAVAALDVYTCAVLSDGTVSCWGANSLSPLAVSGVTSATAVATGVAHTCALLADGTVSCWGDNSSGQLGIGTGTNDPRSGRRRLRRL